MTAGRCRSRIASDDDAVATVVGFVLVLALVVSMYAHVARVDVPRWGADAELAWDARAQDALGLAAAAATQRLAEPGESTILLPPAPEARSVDVPFLGPLRPLPPAGSVTFEPSCASFTATHVAAGGALVVDAQNLSTGCLVVSGRTTYSSPFQYRIEMGGLVRVQRDGAVVLTPPALDAAASASAVNVTLALPSLEGPATGATTELANAQLSFAARGTAAGAAAAPNAQRVQWTMETRDPAAWSAWANASLSRAGIPTAQFRVTCSPADCSAPSGAGEVVVRIEGPRADATADVRWALSHGVVVVALR